MGKVDDVMNGYIDNPERFAEIMDYGIFDARNVINPAKLQELDSASRMQGATSKARDVIKLYNDEAFLVVLGVENQELINYMMPLRIMDYNLRTYEKQRKVISRIHEKNKDLNGSEEFVGGFTKEDRLIPVITLVVYYGKKPWDGSMDLHGMLDISPELEPYRDLIENFKIHVLEVRNIDNFDGFSDELKRVFGFVKHQSDREELQKYVEENAELFEEVPEEDSEAIKVLADSRKLEECIKNNKEGKVTDMCKAIKDWEEESIRIGEKRGIKKGEEKLLISQICKKITKGKTIAEIAEALEMSEAEIEQIYPRAEELIQKSA